MNRKLSLIMLSFLGSISVFSQLTNTGVLKVNSNTLLYSTSKFTNTTAAAAVTTNNGNIKVDGDFEVSDAANPSDFVDVYVNSTDYGQLIIKSTGVVTNKITQQFIFPQKSSYAFAQVSFPFKDYTVTEFNASMGLAPKVFLSYYYLIFWF